MGIRSEKTIYQLIEKRLREADAPMTCVDLMDFNEIRKEAVKLYGLDDHDVRTATNKLSDALGFMWRRGLLTRFPAPKGSTSLARFSYIWDKKEDARPVEPVPSPTLIKKKTGFIVSDYDDGVLIEFEKFIIMVKPKE